MKKEIDKITSTTTAIYQLIDVVQNDISGSASRKSYEMFVTSAADALNTFAVTSSLFQTVHDQDYSLQVANPIFDITVGLYESSNTVNDSTIGSLNGKLLFPSCTLMMREKIDMYKLFAGKLIGDSEKRFQVSDKNLSNPSITITDEDAIDEAIFISFKRLFSRDQIKKESFAMRFYTSATLDGSENATAYEKAKLPAVPYTGSNLWKTSDVGATIFTDIGATASTLTGLAAGEASYIVDSSNSSNKVGLIFYDAGIVVLDAKKVFWRDQHVSGTVSAVTGTIHGINSTIIGSSSLPSSNPSAKFIPDFFVSSSMDDIIDHVASARFSDGTLSAITFQNQTTVNSSLIFCRAESDEFNYSSNPSFIDDSGKIVVIDDGENFQRSFTYATTVGLHDQNGNLLAVAKLSRPIEKNFEKDLTIRVRLDF